MFQIFKSLVLDKLGKWRYFDGMWIDLLRYEGHYLGSFPNLLWKLSLILLNPVCPVMKKMYILDQILTVVF